MFYLLKLAFLVIRFRFLALKTRFTFTMGESLDCNKLYKKDHIEANLLDEEKSGSRYRGLPVKTKTIYENWKVFSKEGHLMFRCN